MKKIKNIFFLVILIAGFLVSACDESTVDLDPIGANEVGYFNNESEMQKAVFGIYSSVRDFYSAQFNHGRPSTWMWLAPSDDITTPSGNAEETFAGITPDHRRSLNFYTYSYRLIARANTVIEVVDNRGDEIYELNPDLKDVHKGEALFLRAWAFWRLWNIFETAPIVTERIKLLNNAFPGNSEGTELLDQAIADLKDAAALLPESWDDANKGRVTSNSAYGLLGKVYVFRGTVDNTMADFTAAIDAFDQIAGVSLTDHYNKNFNYEYENNEESLFEFQAGSTLGGVNAFLSFEDFPGFDLTVYWGFFDQRPVWIGNDIMIATDGLKSAFEDGDPRIPHVFNPNASGVTNITKYVKDGAFARNAAGGNLNPARNNGYNINNPRILRYADILLLKAEAIVRSGGNLADAVALVNQIRTRARFSTEDGMEAAVPANLDATSADRPTVLEWIYEERRRELAIEEGHRWWDLRRRHIAGEIDLKSWDFESMSSDFEFEDFNIRYPLPPNEVVENPNLNQNEGY